MNLTSFQTTIASQHPALYVLLGCPGAGKGTFAQAIKSDGYDHISTGDITREEVLKNTGFGQKYREVILNHVMGGIPFEEIQKLVEQRLENALKDQRGVILDGYPKTLEQCELLDSFINKKELKGRVVVVLLTVDEESVIDRICCRQICEKCHRVYNSKFSPPKNKDTCDDCQIPINQRLDCNIESTKKRVHEFKDKMKDVIHYYRAEQLLHEINANDSIEVCLERFLNFHRSFL